MRYLLLLLLLLLPTLVFAQHPVDPHEAHEMNLWAAIVTVATSLLGLGGWAFRTWWKDRLENKHKAAVEQQLERDWSNGDETLPGKRNPGRTLPQLVEIVHQDLQQHKAETSRRMEHMATESNKRFDKIHSELGEIKGKLSR